MVETRIPLMFKNINKKMEGWFMQVDNKGTLEDLSLMTQGNISLLWIQECIDADNQDMTVGELLKKFRKENDNADIFNPSLLLMASYLFFVYAKEKDFNVRNYSFVDVSKFNVLECESTRRDSNYICRRIRNALAHSRVHIDENLQITFKDFQYDKNNRNNTTDHFECTISFADFGKFINDFFFGVKNRYFRNRD